MSRCTRVNAVAEVVRVDERLAAGVGGERRQRVLRRGQPRELLRRRRGRRRAPLPRPLAWRGVAAGHHRLQAARVDRIDRHVGADGGVDRRAQLDLVVVAAALHAGAEIEDRLLLLDRRQRFGERLQRAQPDVVVEHVHRRRVFRWRSWRRPRPARRWRRCRPSAAASPCLPCSRAPPAPPPTLARSAVKSVSTSSVELTVATATMSAGLICSSTYFVAESTARCTSSGCIELMSNSSTIRRRPASASEVIVLLGAPRLPRPAWPRRPPQLRALRVVRRAALRRVGQQVGGLDRLSGSSEISSNVKLRIVLRLAVLGDLEVGGRQPATTLPDAVADDDVDGDDLGAWRGTSARRLLAGPPRRRRQRVRLTGALASASGECERNA